MNGDKDKSQSSFMRWIEDTNDGFAKWYKKLSSYRVPNKITEKREARRWRRRIEKEDTKIRAGQG